MNGSSAPPENLMPPEDLSAEGARLVSELFKAMGFEATIQARAEADRVEVTATVPVNDELLAGPKGEVRQSLQHIVTLMLNRGRTEKYHLQLEINDFWVRRENELIDLAKKLAEESLLTGAEAITEYLNAQERRVVHMTLKEDPRVRTYAIGTGLIKRVAVAPADSDHGSSSEE